MAQKVKLKVSTVPGKVPASANLDVGEVGINTADKKLYSKHSDGTIIEFGSDIAKDISYGQSLANIHERRVIDSLGSVIPTEIGYELGVLRNKGGLTKATLVTKIGARKPGTLFSVKPFNSTGDFTFAGSAVDEINSAGVSTTVNANESRFDFQGEYVEAADTSYYDADASTGKVTIPMQSFADGESWSVIVKGTFQATSFDAYLVGGAYGRSLIFGPTSLGFRSNTNTFYYFSKLTNSVLNVNTEITWVCNGTTISLYINGILDSAITPDVTDLYVSKFIKGYSDDTNGCSGKNYRNEIWNRALSASEVLDRYNGVAIAPKYIGANNVDLVTNLADRTFTSDTGFWSKGASVTIGAGEATFLGASSYIYVNNFLTIGNVYRIKVHVSRWTSGAVLDVTSTPTSGVYGGITRTTGATTILEFTAVTSTIAISSRSFSIDGAIDLVEITRLGNTLLLDGGKTASTWYDKTHAITGAITGAPLNNPNGFTTNVHPILTKPKLLLEPDAINLFQDSSNPVTQTIPTVIGTKYTCNIKNAGLLTLVETGGNGRGGIVTEVDEFTYIATATSMIVTVVTAPTNVNFTATSFPLRHIPTLPASTATKAVDAINLSGLQANGMLAPTEGSWFVDFGKGITNKATALLEFLQIGLLSGSVFADKISFTSDANNYIAFNYYGNTFTSAIDITNAKVLITWDNTEAILNINGVDVKTWTGITPKAIDYYRSVIQTDLKVSINDTWCRNTKITSQADRNALTT